MSSTDDQIDLVSYLFANRNFPIDHCFILNSLCDEECCHSLEQTLFYVGEVIQLFDIDEQSIELFFLRRQVFESRPTNIDLSSSVKQQNDHRWSRLTETLLVTPGRSLT